MTGERTEWSARQWLTALAITAGAYALLAGAIIGNLAALPDEPQPTDCVSLCFTPRDGMEFVLAFVGWPALVVVLFVTLVVLVVGGEAGRRPFAVAMLAGLLPVLGAFVFTVNALNASLESHRAPPSPEPVVTQCIPRSGGHGCPGG